MPKFLKRIGTALLFAVIALCLAPTLIPPFLDRIYHRGPVSDHFDGERFYNPGFRGDNHGGPANFASRWFSGGRAEWPKRVAVEPGKPARPGPGEMWATWIGHSTVLVQAGGLNILTDPIWSERASPFQWIGPQRARAPGIRFEDLPKIDLVLISHNHYDHMDLPTLKRLWQRDRPVIVTSLGNDTILRNEGVQSRALDWGGRVAARPGLEVTVLRNHHWGSRWARDRNRALWSAFSVRTPTGAFFYAGDTGWGDGSWVREAAGAGPYRLAIIPIGAYEPRDFMKTNHIDPEEAVRIHQAVRPALSLGVHWGTFQLTFEGIDDPPRRLQRELRARWVPVERFVATEVGRPVRVP
ncbi:MAG TPA: MBL fold metallo-hydrolase [Allosphingosinicella sp.]|jgi:L-ascorbate metabolism protein UlaG (beta-lactamase superfamily)|uniref:MBL fold metallo-hydrolase n=1 Tax=Allosphingosinicella sp. TaxID=2823234 RepID=UPI002F2A5E41